MMRNRLHTASLPWSQTMLLEKWLPVPLENDGLLSSALLPLFPLWEGAPFCWISIANGLYDPITPIVEIEQEWNPCLCLSYPVQRLPSTGGSPAASCQHSASRNVAALSSSMENLARKAGILFLPSHGDFAGNIGKVVLVSPVKAQHENQSKEGRSVVMTS